MIKNALWLFAFSLFALFVFLPSYSKLQDLKQQNEDFTRRIEEQKLRKIKLTEELNRLQNDPAYLEKVGREKMGLIRKNEVVYKINTPTNSEKR